jgi:hypothetical protein
MTNEDRIRDLCTQLLAARDDEEIQALVSQLKTAIHDHCAELKVIAAVSFPKSATFENHPEPTELPKKRERQAGA